jgi:hypothetical protein
LSTTIKLNNVHESVPASLLALPSLSFFLEKVLKDNDITIFIGELDKIFLPVKICIR